MSNSMEELYPLILDAFSEKLNFTFPVHGTSMMPMLRTGDRVTIMPVESVHVGDIILYKRKTGEYVLHRVRHIHKTSYTFVGDHQRKTEKGIQRTDLIGKVCSYSNKKNGIERDMKSTRYGLYRILVKSDIMRWIFGHVYHED